MTNPPEADQTNHQPTFGPNGKINREQAFRSDSNQLRCLFGLLDIDPPKAERFIGYLVPGIWDFHV
jgi:hypothetical protein